jgi:hypothetical protein
MTSSTRACGEVTLKPCWMPRGRWTVSPGLASMRSTPRWNVIVPLSR